nr:MAG TPA: hypothetical protein [Caudoviricetes sp.]
MSQKSLLWRRIRPVVTSGYASLKITEKRPSWASLSRAYNLFDFVLCDPLRDGDFEVSWRVLRSLYFDDDVVVARVNVCAEFDSGVLLRVKV